MRRRRGRGGGPRKMWRSWGAELKARKGSRNLEKIKRKKKSMSSWERTGTGNSRMSLQKKSVLRELQRNSKFF